MNSEIKTVIIVHAAAEWRTFHRGSMLAALAEALPRSTALLGVNRPITPDVGPWKHPHKFWSGIWRLAVALDHHDILTVTPRLPLHEMIAPSVPQGVALNRYLLRSQLRAVLKREYPNATGVIQWIYYPEQRWVWDALPGCGKVYECYDDNSRRADGASDTAKWEAEKQVLHEADLCFATAQALIEARKDIARRIVFLPNGVPDSFFRAGPMPGDDPISSVPRPRIGYLGNIFSHLDFALLQEVFKANPEWHLVLVGPVEKRAPVDELRRMPNVHFMGPRPYDQVPSVLRQMDVGLVPFELNDFTRAINPLKLYEYLATGLPVVATRLPELEKFGGLIRLAENDAGAFSIAISETLATDRVTLADRLMESARPYSWTAIVQKHVVPALGQAFDLPG